jgi:integrase
MQNYPKASLVQVKGKWYVQVTVPEELRPAFKDKKQLRLSTGTADRSEAERRLHTKATEIYAKFDEALSTHDPLTVVANELGGYLYGNPVWTPEDWEPGRIGDSEREFDALMYNLLEVEPSGIDQEGMHYLAVMRLRAEELYERYAKELEKRKAGGVQSVRSFSEVASELHSNLQFNRGKTEQAKKLAARKFVKIVGNLPIGRVDRKAALSFVDMLARDLAHNTLQRDVGFVREVFSHAVQQDWIDRNPFDGISLRGKGRATEPRVPFKRSQLKQLFAMPLKEQDRLCLSILSATGMRLDEVALLEWGDIQTEEGIQFFDLQRLHKVVKNRSAERQLPVPSALRLPQRGTGRLFTYRLDDDGKAQNAASKALMKYVNQVRDDPSDRRLTVHSLRHTYKDLLREAEVPDEAQNFLMGHSGSGQGSRYGAGPSLRLKSGYIERLDLSFLAIAP